MRTETETEELVRLRQEMVDLRASHAAQIATLNASHSAQIADLNASHSRLSLENAELRTSGDASLRHCERLQEIVDKKPDWDQVMAFRGRSETMSSEIRTWATNHTSVTFQDVFSYSHSRSNDHLRQGLPTSHSFVSELMGMITKDKTRTQLEIDRMEVLVFNLLLSFANKKYQSEWGVLSSLFLYETGASPLHISMQNRTTGGSLSSGGVQHVLFQLTSGLNRDDQMRAFVGRPVNLIASFDQLGIYKGLFKARNRSDDPFNAFIHTIPVGIEFVFASPFPFWQGSFALSPVNVQSADAGREDRWQSWEWLSRNKPYFWRVTESDLVCIASELRGNVSDALQWCVETGRENLPFGPDRHIIVGAPAAAVAVTAAPDAAVLKTCAMCGEDNAPRAQTCYMCCHRLSDRVQLEVGSMVEQSAAMYVPPTKSREKPVDSMSLNVGKAKRDRQTTSSVAEAGNGGKRKRKNVATSSFPHPSGCIPSG